MKKYRFTNVPDGYHENIKKEADAIESLVFSLAFKLPNILLDNFNHVDVHLDEKIELNYNIKKITNYVLNNQYGDRAMYNLELEDKIIKYFINKQFNDKDYSKNNKFNFISTPDLLKRTIIEACGENIFETISETKNLDGIVIDIGKYEKEYNINENHPENSNQSSNIVYRESFYLSPSILCPFAAFFAKSAFTTSEKKWPIAFFNVANVYQNHIPTYELNKNNENYTKICQSIPFQTKCAGLFVISTDAVINQNAYQTAFSIMKDFYNSLGVNYRIKKAHVNSMKSIDSFKLIFQIDLRGLMATPNLQNMTSSHEMFIDAGYLSCIGDHVSQRLGMMGKLTQASQDLKSCGHKSPYFFLHCVYGQIVNIPLLAEVLFSGSK
ncbi:unnamed protein product [Gordionus sp. m RMFG-2023]